MLLKPSPSLNIRYPITLKKKIFLMIGMREIIFVSFGKLIITKKINVVRKFRVRKCRPHMSGPHVRIRKCRNTIPTYLFVRVDPDLTFDAALSLVRDRILRFPFAHAALKSKQNLYTYKIEK